MKSRTPEPDTTPEARARRPHSDNDEDRDAIARLLGGLLARACLRRRTGRRETSAPRLGARPPGRHC